MDQIEIPTPPSFTEEELTKCRKSGNFCPILYEWYKFVGALCSFFSCIQLASDSVSPIKPLYYSILIGSLNRCSRLMLANVALSQNGLFGETTTIIDRCIFETATKITWLCTNNAEDRFERIVAEGLKQDLIFKDEILAKISSHDNKMLVIEERMLNSINNFIIASTLTEEQIKSLSKPPNLFEMVKENGKNNLYYTAFQRMGSHQIHGSWTSILQYYLNVDEHGTSSPADHSSATHINQYVVISLIVLEAMQSFIKFIISDKFVMDDLFDLIKSVKEEIMSLNAEIVGSDFEFCQNYLKR